MVCVQPMLCVHVPSKPCVLVRSPGWLGGTTRLPAPGCVGTLSRWCVPVCGMEVTRRRDDTSWEHTEPREEEQWGTLALLCWGVPTPRRICPCPVPGWAAGMVPSLCQPQGASILTGQQAPCGASWDVPQLGEPALPLGSPSTSPAVHPGLGRSIIPVAQRCFCPHPRPCWVPALGGATFLGAPWARLPWSLFPPRWRSGRWLCPARLHPLLTLCVPSCVSWTRWQGRAGVTDTGAPWGTVFCCVQPQHLPGSSPPLAP